MQGTSQQQADLWKYCCAPLIEKVANSARQISEADTTRSIHVFI